MSQIFISNSILAGFITSFLVCLLVLLTQRHHGAQTFDATEGVQKFHQTPTPRIGGIALAAGFLVGWMFLETEAQRLFGWLCLAGSPVLIFGLLEDIFANVSVRRRLFASIAAALLFCFLTGFSIERIHVWWFDIFLAVSAISVAFTVLAIATATNAINIIDGFHGLASGTTLIMLAAILFISGTAGDTELVEITALAFAVTLGFFVLNFPFGKIFLGDGGAYFLGFLVAVLTIILPARNPEVSPWLSPLILCYPLTELTVSMARKTRRAGHHFSQPDHLHLHMLVYRTIGRQIGNRPEYISHGLTSLCLWSMPIASLGLILASDLSAKFAYLSTLGIWLFYLFIYNIALRLDR